MTLIGTCALAAVTLIPMDHATIQAGIDNVNTGDTVLVLPGTYTENLNFNGKNIVVMSMDGPVSTTIDGNEVSSVVQFVNGESPAAVLDGFTITNGIGVDYTTVERFGGGIICRIYSSPTLRNLIISGNTATGTGSAGGGIGISVESHPLLENVEIIGNSSSWGGGVSIAMNSNPTFRNVKIVSNYAAEIAGGISVRQSSLDADQLLVYGNDGRYGGGGVWVHEYATLNINRSTIVTNYTDTNYDGGGILITEHSNLYMTNSICWGNQYSEIASHTSGWAASDLLIAHCTIEGGLDGMLIDSNELNTFESIMSSDPLFVDAVNSNYQLDSSSACIDAGSAVYVDSTSGDTLVNLSEGDFNGFAPDMGCFEYYSTTSLDHNIVEPTTIKLLQNYPNPFNPATTIPVMINENNYLSLEVYDLRGSHIRTLFKGMLHAGTYEFRWEGDDLNGRKVSSGVYIYGLKSGREVLTKKMSYLR